MLSSFINDTSAFVLSINLLGLIRVIAVLALIFVLVKLVGIVLQIFTSNWLRKKFIGKYAEAGRQIIKTVNGISWVFFMAVAIQIWYQFVSLPVFVFTIAQLVSLVVLSFYFVQVLVSLVDYVIDNWLQKAEADTTSDKSSAGEDQGEDAFGIQFPHVDETVSVFIKVISKALIWIVAFLIIVQNLGYNLTAVLGGLGLIGLAIGFAVQNVLEDILSFFTIYFDKPFAPGDSISTGADSGTVQKIGIKSTRLKTIRGEELIISNNELVNSRVNNHGRMKARRVSVDLGVSYETSAKLLKEIPKVLGEIVKKVEHAEFKRAHHKAFGEFAMIYELVYVVPEKDYELYMDVNQEINLTIIDKFAELGIVFAQPNRTTILTK